MEKQRFSMELAGRELTIETGLLANQAHGAVTVSLGDTVVFSSAVMGDAREGTDFFPMMVDYEEKYYAAGKIKGSRFIKREGRPSERAVINSRLIDRPIRPLFPKGMINDVQLICTVLSCDMEVEPGTTALIAASAALTISGMPFEGPVGAVRMGYVEENGSGKIVINPTYEQVEKGKLDLVVAGTMEAITMVEAAAKEVSEDIILQALQMAHEEIKKICALQLKLKEAMNPQPREVIMVEKPEAVVTAVEQFLNKEMMDGVTGKTKKEVKERIHDVENDLMEKCAAQLEAGEFTKSQLKEAINSALEKNMRNNILEKEVRLDGRKVDEIRTLSSMVGILPRPHGSALFQRGETQALTMTTLGGPGAAQIVDTMDKDEERRYFHHYNFPPYSVGEVKPLRGPSRRDIGHGDLAERALLPVIPSKAEFPYTIWVASEIMSCNGSSSMASVCGSTLSLMHAGVPIKRPVAGIAMGLVAKNKDLAQGYKILTDIQGMEDFAGDMDFKVTGSSEGITALQMDIKVKGLSLDVMKEALDRAKQARSAVLEHMATTIAQPNKELSKYAPMIMFMNINPDLIKVVIGKGGETIQKITAECDVEIDVEQDGLITITAKDQESGQKALDWVKRLTYEPKVGDVFDGKVVKIMEFGAFVEFLPGKDGLVHISELAKERVNKVEDVVKEGDTLKVKLMAKDSQGRYNLSHKATLE
ncbi:polyribonucleotide nucleotidyltransferase [Patescibacteria group bacterium]|nr:polyribonucleotide nucleotidyltransferase [Patescibacteria group bacterium]MBU1703121.1 polyribonucleotide nucleotidyltransferase [Patescibacteria group bacterium]MBU1954353.1 polyribonucleotide nucleotidyltransferase [Patescibacteria group bacterium]